ncbi:dynein axonemal assembly factor 3 [Rhinophrynus dorsalis]
MATAGRRGMCPAWWGFSPAVDLQMHCHQSTIQHMSSADTPELNILLVGGGDGRHLLKTICQSCRWPRRKLNFYIIESDLELLARHMLFLTVALEHPKQMGLQEKSEIFLELFGNSLIRSKTATYLQERCELFIHYVTDPDFQQSTIPSLNLSSIKFKERDALESIFKFWRTSEHSLFPIERYWDVKNREYLGRRYDSRKGAYDWDLSMKLHDRGAGVINSVEYNRWREKGVAFMIREGIYDVPNKTLATHMMMTHGSGKMLTRSFCGDITTSPYIAFGIETEEESLLQTANGVHMKTAEEVSQYNILSLFHELVTGQRYSLPTGKLESEATKPCPSSSLSPEANGEEQAAKSTDENTEQQNLNQSATYNFIPLDNVQIHFLPFSWVNELHRKSKFLDFFNIVYFSCSMVHFLKPEYKLICSRKATLVLELTKFMVDLQTEKLKSYISIVTKVAEEAGFKTTEIFDWKRDYIATFERVDEIDEQQNGQ